jgi:hypothetical protein
MPTYSAFIALASGDYQEVDWLIDAPDPWAAAKQVVDADVLAPGDDFPLMLIVEEQHVSVFSCDRLGRVATPSDTIDRRLRERQGPNFRVVAEERTDTVG